MHRVVVTGMGVVTPIGNNVPDFEKALYAGISGVGPLTRVPEKEQDGLAVRIAAEIKGFDLAAHLDKKAAADIRNQHDLFAHYAVVAAIEAVRNADLVIGDPLRVIAPVATGDGGLETLLSTHRVMLERGPDRIRPLSVVKLMPNSGSYGVSKTQGVHGWAPALSTACASGSDAIALSYVYLSAGRCDVAIAGGAEAAVTKFALGGFTQANALATHYNDSPAEASRPFDARREGFVIGEGAGIVVLETLEHALTRGATIYAELKGVGQTSDAGNPTDPDTHWQVEAMRLALKEAGIQPEQIGYINAHGTSTPIGDVSETNAIKKVFGSHAEKLNISSIKSMTGHMMGASGAVEAIATILALRSGTIPPTINYEHPDPDCDLNYTPNKAVEKEMSFAMSNSFGFGGHNSVLVFGKVQPPLPL